VKETQRKQQHLQFLPVDEKSHSELTAAAHDGLSSKSLTPSSQHLCCCTAVVLFSDLPLLLHLAAEELASLGAARVVTLP
jgi:hypothetical protein